jgi:glucosamine-6-phosphate deaminase
MKIDNMFKSKKVKGLEVKIFNSRVLMGEQAASNVAQKINQLLAIQPKVNIIFAAAPSQNEFLAALTTQNIDWSRINAFHMDEYIGLSKDAPQGFGNFLKSRIFGLLPFKTINYLNGNAFDIKDECLRYQNLLNEYPTDIVCMGIGENGHLAFNDPPVADFNDPEMVKEVELEEMCRQQQVNDGCFETIDDVPTHALTLTIPALIKAPYLSLVVPGPSKSQAVYNTLNKPVNESHPSTILTTHPDAVLYLDMDSSNLL